jgi:hypothetical protein
MESEGIAPCILSLGTRWRCLISFTLRPPQCLRKSSGYPFNTRLVVSEPIWTLQRRWNSLPLPRIKPRLPFRPARSLVAIRRYISHVFTLFCLLSVTSGSQYHIWPLVSLVYHYTLFIIFIYKHISPFFCTCLLSAHYVHVVSDFIAIFWIALLYLCISFFIRKLNLENLSLSICPCGQSFLRNHLFFYLLSNYLARSLYFRL